MDVTPSNERRARRPFRERFGCIGVLLLLAAGGTAAALFPLVGVPVVVIVIGTGLHLMRRAMQRERQENAAKTARLRAIAAPVGDAWRRLLAAEGLEDHVATLQGLTRPAVRMVARRADVLSPGQSRLGGTPDLPADVPWPRYQERPLDFVGQLDLAEVHLVLGDSPLPAAGHLWFFFDPEQTGGYEPSHAGAGFVLFRAEGTSLVRTDPPVSHRRRVFPACALRMEAFEDLPDLDEDNPIDRLLDEAATERYQAIRSFLSSGEAPAAHRLLGYAEPIQDSMELECQLVTNGLSCGTPAFRADPRVEALARDKGQWRLLLEVSSDDETEMMWSDAGCVYFWIRQGDLAERRFDRCWTIMQCH